MFRNDRKTYYREKASYGEDYDLWMVLLSRGKRMVLLPDIVIKYRVHPKSITSSRYRKQRMFGEKAVEWYYERKKFGKDSYDKFDPNTILSLKDNNIYNDIYMNKKKIELLLLEDKKKYRKELRIYLKKNGLKNWKRLPLSYVLSFFPTTPLDILSDNHKKFKKWFKYYLMKRKLQ